jgi:hypothetical protein
VPPRPFLLVCVTLHLRANYTKISYELGRGTSHMDETEYVPDFLASSAKEVPVAKEVRRSSFIAIILPGSRNYLMPTISRCVYICYIFLGLG